LARDKVKSVVLVSLGKLTMTAVLLLLAEYVAQAQGQPAAQPQNAQPWRTADGVLEVLVPAGFELQPQPPGVVGSLWQEPSTGIAIIVLQMSIPPNARLNPKDLQNGLVQESDGQAGELSTESIQGFTVFSMSVSTNKFQSETVVKQRVIITPTVAYKLMAHAIPDAFRTDSRLEQFLKSIKIHTSAVPKPLTTHRPLRPLGWNEIGGQIGALGVFLLVGCGLWVWAQRSAEQRNERLRRTKQKSRKPRIEMED
jgi:uncharacterized iron-regulated membrane protein